MLNGQQPWIETAPTSQRARYQQEGSSIWQHFPWQAMFACQIGVRPFEERSELKWGFNAAALLDEALDRQKLFVESQLACNPIDEQKYHRTLALRCVSVPNVGMRLGLIGKVLAESQEQAEEYAKRYCRELVAIFPYDYTIHPILTEEEYKQITGIEILKKCTTAKSISQIQRFEQPLHTSQGVFRMIGLWQTNPRSDEQIWRALLNYSKEVLLNISIHPTLLTDEERRALLELKRAIQSPQEQTLNEPYLENYNDWIAPFINRYIPPWNRFFYLQVHLVSPIELEENISRLVGSAITRELNGKPSPGFQAVHPTDNNRAIEWCSYLENLEINRTNLGLQLPRLSDLADLNETHAVFRFPYPHGLNLANIVFLEN